jgi:hypothetical protein
MDGLFPGQARSLLADGDDLTTGGGSTSGGANTAAYIVSASPAADVSALSTTYARIMAPQTVTLTQAGLYRVDLKVTTYVGAGYPQFTFKVIFNEAATPVIVGDDGDFGMQLTNSSRGVLMEFVGIATLPLGATTIAVDAKVNSGTPAAFVLLSNGAYPPGTGHIAVLLTYLPG